MQSSRPDSVMDRLGRISDLAQLIAGYDPMLIFGQIPRLARHTSSIGPPVIGRLVN